MKRYELIGVSGKGLNHKALVEESDEEYRLLSYGTHVATIRNGKMRRIDGQPQSNTTARHMREFALFLGLPYMTKSELLKLPTA